MTAAAPPWLRAAVPGSSLAVPQVPFRSPATNACSRPEPSAYPPPAAQLPADAHDTELATAPPPALRAAVPGTSCAVPQVPPKTTAPASAAAGTTPAASMMLTPATTAAASPPPSMPRTGLITMTTPPCRPVATPVPGPFAGVHCHQASHRPPLARLPVVLRLISAARSLACGRLRPQLRWSNKMIWCPSGFRFLRQPAEHPDPRPAMNP